MGLKYLMQGHCDCHTAAIAPLHEFHREPIVSIYKLLVSLELGTMCHAPEPEIKSPQSKIHEHDSLIQIAGQHTPKGATPQPGTVAKPQSVCLPSTVLRRNSAAV
ncbi:hypothetical protein MPTK1_5g07050 [Marchantia polymorpha subsp. ruderalis]|uniref:Uncharacterized protein n=2 Tax=Marchantia polymorpha TaxID=3197 RepID=A0AAF6BFS8_MARPO|nr:hypothetical protein MARPO_0136s0016 [Marchantia polymorpha]BBN10862.1 hypothetical protein Mp_5g07050 [Marchantia polymorpha subsp. ruderalis]|eukprot:PTQ29688.1 hypothetical protein MARPO_0136s0016 [Marchantia polymorpha]